MIRDWFLVNSSTFSTNEITQGFYSFEELSEVLTQISQLGFDGFNNSNDIELNDFSMKTELIVRPIIIVIRFD